MLYLIIHFPAGRRRFKKWRTERKRFWSDETIARHERGTLWGMP